jgi:hypothetical protein
MQTLRDGNFVSVALRLLGAARRVKLAFARRTALLVTWRMTPRCTDVTIGGVPDGTLENSNKRESERR